MTISEFVNNHHDPSGGPVGGRGARRRYRAHRRVEAQDRQARFDADVALVAAEQNCLPETARAVVRARRRFEHNRADR